MEEFGLTSLSGRQAPRSVCTPTNKDLGVVVIRDTVTLVVVSDFRRFDPNPLIPWVSGRLEADLMHPVRWCNGCLCGLGSQSSDPYGKMTSEDIYNLPLNVYVIILGIGLFIFMLSLIFCCYMFRLRRQGTREQYGYNEVVLKGAGKKLSLLGQTCAVCLEEFKSRDELGVCTCSHAFHKKCLLKWLEIRSVCPMCNKPICRLQPDPPQGTEGPQSPMEV